MKLSVAERDLLNKLGRNIAEKIADPKHAADYHQLAYFHGITWRLRQLPTQQAVQQPLFQRCPRMRYYPLEVRRAS